jgi:hypothetical protein
MLRLRGARGTDLLTDLNVPDRFFFVPQDFPRGDPLSVGQMYGLLAKAIHAGASRAPMPTFHTAVGLHRFLDAIKQSSDSGLEVSLV